MIKFIKRNLKLITIINVMIIISSLIICKYFLLQKEEKNDEGQDVEGSLEDGQG